MPTRTYEYENLTPTYIAGRLDVDAGAVATDEATIQVTVIGHGIGLQVEEKLPRGDAEALGETVSLMATKWRILNGITLAPPEIRALARILNRAATLYEQTQQQDTGRATASAA